MPDGWPPGPPVERNAVLDSARDARHKGGWEDGHRTAGKRLQGTKRRYGNVGSAMLNDDDDDDF